LLFCAAHESGGRCWLPVGTSQQPT
jgi:hypothetical protein